MIKLKTRRQEEYPELSRRVHCNHRGLKEEDRKGRVREGDAVPEHSSEKVLKMLQLLALKVEEGARS